MSTDYQAPTLFEIGDDMRQLDEFIQSLDGDISDPAVEAAIDSYLEENLERLADKLEGYGWLIREKASKGAARKERANELLALAKQDSGLADRLKSRVTEFFKLHELKTVETDTFKFNLQGSGGRRPMKMADRVTEDPKGTLPKKYVRMVPMIDLDKLREDLEKIPEDKPAPANLAGLVWLEPRGSHLVIK